MIYILKILKMNGTNQNTASNLWRLRNLANDLGLRDVRLNSTNFGKVLNVRLGNGTEFSSENFSDVEKFLLSVNK